MGLSGPLISVPKAEGLRGSAAEGVGPVMRVPAATDVTEGFGIHTGTDDARKLEHGRAPISIQGKIENQNQSSYIHVHISIHMALMWPYVPQRAFQRDHNFHVPSWSRL